MVNNINRKRAVSFLMRVMLYCSALVFSLFLLKHPPPSLVNWESLDDVRETGSELFLQCFVTCCGSNRHPRNVVLNELRYFVAAQEIYREKHLRYGSIPELVSEDLLDKSWLLPQHRSYKYSLFVYTEYEFEVVAIVMPNDYGCERNYFVDQSGVTRWAKGNVPNRQSSPVDQK